MSFDFLVRSARQATYVTLDDDKLEKLWKLSNTALDKSTQQLTRSDWYLLLEQHFYLSVITGHDRAAKLMLQRAIDQFGSDSQRVTAMQTAYCTVVEPEGPQPSNNDTHSQKQRFLHLKTAGKGEEYVKKLVEYLDSVPSDGEAWSELADAYALSGNYPLAIKALHHVLLFYPFAYNIFARLGEIRHLQSTTIKSGIQGSLDELTDSVAHFSRSVEICPTYIRGWAGIYVVSTKLSQWPRSPNRELYEKLKKKAHTKLEILATTGNPRDPDVIGAKQLLKDS